jgi:hypothetical protein
MTQPPAGLLESLLRSGPAVRSLTLGLRQVILEELAPCHEYILDMRTKMSLIYSSTERAMADAICYIGVYRTHVNLGFQRGVDLDDAAGMLRGTGNAMRHIQVKTLSELDRPELRMYLRQARRLTGLKPRRKGAPADVVTRMKRTMRIPPRAREPW